MPLARGLRQQPSGVSLPEPDRYMFDSHLPLFTRGLSLFHGWLPLLLVWLLFRLVMTKGLCLPGPAWLRRWASSATFIPLLPASIWPIPTFHQHQLSLRFQRPAAATLGQPKPLCHPVAGGLWLVAFFPRTWPCGKSSPRHRQRSPEFEFAVAAAPCSQPGKRLRFTPCNGPLTHG